MAIILTNYIYPPLNDYSYEESCHVYYRYCHDLFERMSLSKVELNQSISIFANLLQAMADGGAESTPPSDDDPIPNSLFPTDWSFSAIIDFFF